MNKKIIGVLGLASVALVGGTFAYFTQTSTIDNPFNTAKYGTVVTEEFHPEDGDKWKPGAEVNKDLYVDNTGDRDVVVRVKYEEFWSRNTVEGDPTTAVEIKSLDSSQTMGAIYQEDPEDGLIESDGTVVHKIFAPEAEGKWSDLQEDGYYYYLTKLAPGTSTGKFLDKVKLDGYADIGKMMTQYYYTTSEERPPLTALDQWIILGDPQPAKASKVTPPDGSTFTMGITGAGTDENGNLLLGYSSANYTLRITVQTVQATDKAAASVFKITDESSESLKTIMSNWNLDSEELEESSN